jgi:chromosome segregation ATPase
MRKLLVGCVALCATFAVILDVLALGQRSHAAAVSRNASRVQKESAALHQQASTLGSQADTLERKRADAASQIDQARTAADATAASLSKSSSELSDLTDAINHTLTHPLTSTERRNINDDNAKLHAAVDAALHDLAALQGAAKGLEAVSR